MRREIRRARALLTLLVPGYNTRGFAPGRNEKIKKVDKKIKVNSITKRVKGSIFPC